MKVADMTQQAASQYLPSFRLDGKVAVITGASRGLGLEMARGLASAGARVYLNGRNQSQLETVANAEEHKALCLIPLAFDVEDPRATKEAVDRVLREEGGIDILVNNVGQRDRRGLAEHSIESLQSMLNNHVVASFYLSQLVYQSMSERGGGRIINMTSLSAFLAARNDLAYSTAKGALVSMTRAMAAELGSQGVTVNAIAPGPFATETNADKAASPDGQAWLARRSALGRWGQPSEIAGAAVFLASDAASFITGQVLSVDGGLSIHY